MTDSARMGSNIDQPEIFAYLFASFSHRGVNPYHQTSYPEACDRSEYLPTRVCRTVAAGAGIIDQALFQGDIAVRLVARFLECPARAGERLAVACWPSRLVVGGCTKAAPPAAAAPQAMPVQVQPVSLSRGSQLGHLCGDDQEPALGDAAAAGGRQPDEDPGEVRRRGEGRPAADADRSAEAGGDGRSRSRGPSSSRRRCTTTTRPTWRGRSSSTRTASSPSRRTTRRCRRSRTPRRRWMRPPR